jgi:hypothetical protein
MSFRHDKNRGSHGACQGRNQHHFCIDQALQTLSVHVFHKSQGLLLTVEDELAIAVSARIALFEGAKNVCVACRLAMPNESYILCISWVLQARVILIGIVRELRIAANVLGRF